MKYVIFQLNTFCDIASIYLRGILRLSTHFYIEVIYIEVLELSYPTAGVSIMFKAEKSRCYHFEKKVELCDLYK